MTAKIRKRISYEGSVIEDWDAFADEMSWATAERIESAFGDVYPAWTRAVDSGSISARRILAWCVLQQDNPALRVAQVTGSHRALKIEDLGECPTCGEETPVTTYSRRGDDLPAGTYCDVCDTQLDAVTANPTPAESTEGSASDDESTKPPSPDSSESDPGSGDT